MKPKTHKIVGRKGQVAEFTEVACFKDELPHKGTRGYTTHPVVLDIFNRLKTKGIEEAIKFEFTDLSAANRFKYMLNHYNEVRKLNVHVGHVGTTVYIYNKEASNAD